MFLFNFEASHLAKKFKDVLLIWWYPILGEIQRNSFPFDFMIPYLERNTKKFLPLLISWYPILGEIQRNSFPLIWWYPILENKTICLIVLQIKFLDVLFIQNLFDECWTIIKSSRATKTALSINNVNLLQPFRWCYHVWRQMLNQFFCFFIEKNWKNKLRSPLSPIEKIYKIFYENKKIFTSTPSFCSFCCIEPPIPCMEDFIIRSAKGGKSDKAQIEEFWRLKPSEH